MKKSKYIYVINWLLMFSIPFIVITANVKTDIIDSKIDTKNLQTNLFRVVELADKNTELENKKEETNDLEIDEDTNNITKEVSEKKTEKQEIIEEKPVIKEENKQEVVEEKQELKSDVIETFTGNLSYYRANCSDCSGFTSTGFDVRDGKLYYNDPTYGNVRIIASGPEIPKYSIVRIKNSSLASNFLAIVLDRGGDIGQGRKFIVDILTNSKEAKGGVDYGVSIEVIRKGK